MLNLELLDAHAITESVRNDQGDLENVTVVRDGIGKWRRDAHFRQMRRSLLLRSQRLLSVCRVGHHVTDGSSQRANLPVVLPTIRRIRLRQCTQHATRTPTKMRQFSVLFVAQTQAALLYR